MIDITSRPSVDGERRMENRNACGSDEHPDIRNGARLQHPSDRNTLFWISETVLGRLACEVRSNDRTQKQAPNGKWRASRIVIFPRGLTSNDFITWFLHKGREVRPGPEKVAIYLEH